MRKGYNTFMANIVKNSEKKTRGGSKKGERRGGRQKGTPNKKTLEFIEALGDFNPVDTLMQICSNSNDDGLKAHICLNLLKYIYPQRKAVEMDLQNPINLEPIEVQILK